MQSRSFDSLCMPWLLPSDQGIMGYWENLESRVNLDTSPSKLDTTHSTVGWVVWVGNFHSNDFNSLSSATVPTDHGPFPSWGLYIIHRSQEWLESGLRLTPLRVHHTKRCVAAPVKSFQSSAQCCRPVAWALKDKDLWLQPAWLPAKDTCDLPHHLWYNGLVTLLTNAKSIHAGYQIPQIKVSAMEPPEDWQNVIKPFWCLHTRTTTKFIIHFFTTIPFFCKT